MSLHSSRLRIKTTAQRKLKRVADEIGCFRGRSISNGDLKGLLMRLWLLLPRCVCRPGCRLLIQSQLLLLRCEKCRTNHCRNMKEPKSLTEAHCGVCCCGNNELRFDKNRKHALVQQERQHMPWFCSTWIRTRNLTQYKNGCLHLYSRQNCLKSVDLIT